MAISCKLDKTNCNDKESAYIDKTAAWDASKAKQELDRVQKLLLESSKSVKEDLMEWMKRRKNVLEQLVAKSDGDAAEL